MEKVARWNEALLLPERGITLPPAVDANLRDRVRSLLASRNQKNPPKTPCPSPDFDFIPRISGENSSGLSPSRTRRSSFSPAIAIQKLSQFENRSSDMGVLKFDGPAGQMLDDSSEFQSRRPSQPKMYAERRSSDDWPQRPVVQGLDQKSRGDIVGRKASVPESSTGLKSSASKRSTESKIPRFHLRTVPPTVNVNKALRPNPLHVPGSYRSETQVNKGQASAAAPFNDDLVAVTAPDVLAQASARNTSLESEPVHKALDVLHHVANHDRQHHESPRTKHPSVPVNETMTLPTTKQSNNPQDPLWRPLASYAATNKGPQPTRTTDEVSGTSKEDAAETEMFVVGTDEDEKTSNVIALSNKDPISIKGSNIAVEPVTDQPPPSTGRNIVSSAATLPSEPTAFKVGAPAQGGGGHLGTVAPLQSNGPERSTWSEGAAIDNAAVPLIPTTRRSSRSTTKASPVSRALSMLSEISARTKTSSFSKISLVNHEGNLTNRPKHRSIPNSTKASGQGGYRALTDKDEEHRVGLANSAGAIELTQQKPRRESITRVITDLESVLKEALNIAGQASGRGSSRGYSRHYKRAGSRSSSASLDSQASLLEKADEEDNEMMPHRLGSNHTQDQVVINDFGSESIQDSHFKKPRGPTSYPAKTRHASGLNSGDPGPKFEGSDASYSALPVISVQDFRSHTEPQRRQAFNSADFAVSGVPSKPSKLRLEVKPSLSSPQRPSSVLAPSKEQHSFLVREHGDSEDAQTRNSIRDYVHANQGPPVQPRMSSMRLRATATQTPKSQRQKQQNEGTDDDESDCECVPYVADFKTSGIHYHPVYQSTAAGEPSEPPRRGPFPFAREDTILNSRIDASRANATHDDDAPPATNTYSLEGRHHFSVREPHGFSLSRSHRRSPIARDWSKARKRFTASVACITTAFIGMIIGIYAGEVPAIQYAIADEHHYTILGNVLFFIGMAITTGLFYPLPLLHGRKPYTLAALALVLPLTFPQALSVNSFRTPYVATYRVGLLVPRVIAGLLMGFANINLITTLLDLFGSSLQSGNPHQEIVNENDVRRHGGGMGVWLGIWTWCYIGSIGVGFLIGACIISGLNVSWGFWILIIINAAVLVLNILTPEVRRSAYRRSMAEVREGGEVSRRVARGEIKMHLESTGPLWWGEEVFAGHVLAIRMLKQPGFMILTFYLGWIYAQVVIVIVLLGALLSKYYRFHPQYVGLGVAIIPLGALLAVPFQLASLFSRSRHHPQRTDSMTFEKRVTWTSHLVRRAIFMILLPFADLAYTLSSGGRPTHYMVPIMFAGVIGFLSNLAIAECNGIIMETYDTSDLQPGMTGRPRRVLPEEIRKKRTNFSCFPRVTAGFAMAQTFAFAIAAAATAWGGVVERHVGAQTATASMAGVLLVLTLLLTAALWRFKTVQIIPSERFGTNILSGPEDEWKPVIIGNPSGTTRRMSLLEMGALSRWTEIRRKNKLAPET